MNKKETLAGVSDYHASMKEPKRTVPVIAKVVNKSQHDRKRPKSVMTPAEFKRLKELQRNQRKAKCFGMGTYSNFWSKDTKVGKPVSGGAIETNRRKH